MNTKILIGVLAVGGVFILVTIFGSSDNEVLDENTKTTETQAEKTTLATLPEDMPTNVPMYPGSILQSTQRNDTVSEKNITLSLATDDSVADVNTWYRGSLSENGWVVTDDRDVGGYILLKGENGNLTTFTQVANNSEIGKVIITQRIRIR